MSDSPSLTSGPLEQQPPEQATPQLTGMQVYQRLLTYVRPYLGFFGISLLGYLIFAVTTPATAAWLGWTIDQIEAGNADARIISPILCVLIVLVRGIGGFLGHYSLEHIANHVVHKLRTEVLDQLLNVPVRYYDANTTGRLVSKVTYDVMQIKGAATSAVTVMLREGLTVIGLLAWLFWVNWRLSLVFLLVAPCMALIVHLATKRYRRYSRQMQDSMGDVTQIANESIKGQKVIRTFNAAGFVLDRFLQASERNRRQNMKMVTTEATATPLIQLIVAMAMAILIWLALAPEFLGGASAGEVVTFLTLAGMLSKPLRQLSGVNAIIQRGIAAASSIFELLDSDRERDDGTYRTERARGRVDIEQLSFAYDPDKPVLDSVNLQVQPGMTVALVGRSGSGKSTLVNLLPRFYDFQQGEIRLDDVPLKDYQLANLRDQIAIVTQDVVLFEGSVADNIAYGLGDLMTREQIEQAARDAHADEFIQRLPGGYDAEIGDGGSLLSGGQRQRLAIARAFLKNAPLLILDEATSALDTESEQHIQQALSELIRGRTTFVIAHRLSTIENADLIVVMDQGHIVERGTHQELLALNQHYARLHRMQFSEQLDDPLQLQRTAPPDGAIE
ncbi:lipid A export permease/ATP-binding protein MsbA [Pseudohongiella spirulinae]|uniref:Lipid transporter ATP-binding/permease n=1 Tax=Pseudohongiella spirulinae TaxID=1249552 RepID=A0A0S2KDS7_9GAMM|nr:lipid transporter ATP-binding/permease [Pseudohongiella spirulinae]